MNVTDCVLSLRRVLCFILLVSVQFTEGRSWRRDLGICSGSARIDIKSADGVKIEPTPISKVYIDSLSKPFEDGHSMKFEFKTTSADGTLFYAVRRNDEYDMVSGGLYDGFLKFKIRCRTSYTDLTIPKYRVNDGEWHQVKFQRKHGKGIFMLDEIEFFEQYYVGCGGFTSINFGSSHPEHTAITTTHDLKDRDGLLSGCIRRFHITTNIEVPPQYSAVSECN